MICLGIGESLGQSPCLRAQSAGLELGQPVSQGSDRPLGRPVQLIDDVAVGIDGSSESPIEVNPHESPVAPSRFNGAVGSQSALMAYAIAGLRGWPRKGYIE